MFYSLSWNLTKISIKKVIKYIASSNFDVDLLSLTIVWNENKVLVDTSFKGFDKIIFTDSYLSSSPSDVQKEFQLGWKKKTRLLAKMSSYIFAHKIMSVALHYFH